jgi:hypothetical protein
MGDTSLDAQFRELDYDVDIERELEALKGGSGASVGQLESGSEDSGSDSSI